MILVWATIGTMIWQIAVLIDQFIQYQVVTGVETQYVAHIDFPQVTVCSANPCLRYKQEKLNIWKPRNRTELVQISYELDELIPIFSFNDENQDSDNKSRWNPVVTTFGQCFRFETQRMVARSGISGGLELFAVLSQDQFSNDSVLAGLLIFVHQPGTTISEGYPFISVSPGQYNLISISQTVIRRETEEPWKNCYSTDMTFSNAACRDLCLEQALVNRCGCVRTGSPYFPEMRYCVEDVDAECLANFSTHHFRDDEGAEFEDCCECVLPPCQETVYTTKVSAMKMARGFLRETASNLNLTAEDVNDDVVPVHINYDAINRQIVTESKSMTKTELFANIGGQMGLFAGISIISLLDVFGELMLLRLIPRLWGDRRFYGVGGRN